MHGKKDDMQRIATSSSNLFPLRIVVHASYFSTSSIFRAEWICTSQAHLSLIFVAQFQFSQASQGSCHPVSLGCQPDLAQNLLVDPEGNELLCTDTSLTPDDVNQISTCPTLKNQLVSGEWSVLIISNNGNGSAIAYERDLYLTVGVPTTITVSGSPGTSLKSC
ncbi:hypothetical protein KVT40_004760 [Elsinoe batatas]|uniref:Uncharacterized protein n=1 Tax=Elsinoe batatas TaxID=2601811 RepID=A0A8K0L1B6_9PEZI|nr:hypothetical protein KVT40_004760 [Elsinoe batatas]